MYITRFAPSPTGHLHLGHAFAALTAWRRARAGGGRFLLRIEDIDRDRCRDEYMRDLVEDLAWLGLDWDGDIRMQSRHLPDYAGVLETLAEQTGGREYAVENIAELPDIAAKIGIELRNEYMLGYTPKNRERDGKYRRVQVKLNQPRGLPPLKAYFRLGYYAPTQ